MSPLIESWIVKVCAARGAYRLPFRADALAGEFVADALALLFPHFASHRRCDSQGVGAELSRLEESLRHFMLDTGYVDNDATSRARAFVNQLPGIHDDLLLDAQATCDADPAATNVDEVILAYPGFYALACHRFAHELWTHRVALLPRLISETAHRTTGIDIHPGATLGRAIAIDHGTGIVIGETSVIGDRVRLYQGVTLGALSVRKALSGVRRHPTLESDVVVYANATILGGDTVVGHSSVIGGNVWLTHSVPPYSVVTNLAVSEGKSTEAAQSLDVVL
ncbi:MAG: serine O-acetyltransferase EpsC [Acidobacteriota bacterium]